MIKLFLLLILTKDVVVFIGQADFLTRWEKRAVLSEKSKAEQQTRKIVEQGWASSTFICVSNLIPNAKRGRRENCPLFQRSSITITRKWCYFNNGLKRSKFFLYFSILIITLFEIALHNLFRNVRFFQIKMKIWLLFQFFRIECYYRTLFCHS